MSGPAGPGGRSWRSWEVGRTTIPELLLLAHIREAFEGTDDKPKAPPEERLFSAELLRLLVDRGDSSPWAGWWGDDIDSSRVRRPAMAMAKILRAYGIRSKDVWKANVNQKGYGERGDFTEAWAWYGSTLPVSEGESVS